MDKFNLKSLTKEQKDTRRRVLEISFKRKFSHLGSCLSAVDLIDAVYQVKKINEQFVLSNGHAAVAFYAVLEKNAILKDHNTTEKLNVHPDRNPNIGIFASTGSLGQGLPIALGIALSDRESNVYCLISDGECAEGSIWETLRIARENRVNNLKILINANGWSAYESIYLPDIIKKLKGFGYEVKKINGHNINEIIEALKSTPNGRSRIIFAQTSVNQFPFLKDQDAHYHVLTSKDYKKALNLLE